MSAKSFTASFGDISLKVSPKEMYQTASGIEAKIQRAKNIAEEINRIVKDTSSFWEGSAAQTERNYFSEEFKNFDIVTSNLTGYVSELRQITYIYESSEDSLSEYAQTLPSNILN